MSISIITDQFEPFEIGEEMKKSIPVSSARLEPLGMLDYLWWTHDNKTMTLERKSVQDLAGRVEDLEVQLKKTLPKADYLAMVVEGVMRPIDSGKDTLLYRLKKDGSIYYSVRTASRPYNYYMGFLYRLFDMGIPVFWTNDMMGTAELLVELVKKSNDATPSGIFQRIIRAKRAVQIPDQQIQSLVNLGMGVKTSELLIAKFNTAWKTFNATEKQICAIKGLGDSTVEKLNKLIGRE